jgi:hypothetical protein
MATDDKEGAAHITLRASDYLAQAEEIEKKAAEAQRRQNDIELSYSGATAQSFGATALTGIEKNFGPSALRTSTRQPIHSLLKLFRIWQVIASA